MSTFSEWELNGGLDPYAEPEVEDNTSPCGCNDPRCRIDGNDATNMLVNGTWFSAECCGLCMVCNEVDDLSKLMKAGGGRFLHAFGCPDHMNLVRR